MEDAFYKRINSETLWENYKAKIDNLSIEDGGLRLASTYSYEFRDDENKNLDITNINDIAVDECGQIYILNEKNIFRYHKEVFIGSATYKSERLPFKLTSPNGIDVISDKIYIADNNKLIVYNLKNLDEAWQLFEIDGIPLNEVKDLATGFKNYVYIIEMGKEPRIHIIRDEITKGVNEKSIGSGMLSNPGDIAVDIKGNIYTLDGKSVKIFRTEINQKSYFFSWTEMNKLFSSREFKEKDGEDIKNCLIHIYGKDWVKYEHIKVEKNTIEIHFYTRQKEDKNIIKLQREPTKIMISLSNNKKKIYESHFYKENNEQYIYEKINIDFQPKGLAVDARNQIYVGVAEDYLDVFKQNAAIYKLQYDGILIPLWLYREHIRKMWTDTNENLYVVNNTGGKLTYLNYSKINMLNNDGFYSGYYSSKKIDSIDFKTRWNRILLEGEFKKGTQIEFLYYISNEDSDNPEGKWHKSLLGVSSIQGEEVRDAIFQENVQGRYLWFKIYFTGNENNSPIVKSLTVFFPKVSYYDHLPAIYQRDPASRGFFERFLSIFESVYYDIDFKIEHLSSYLDACGAPSGFLSWLGYWLAIPMDENFSDNMKRLYIQQAISLYKKRGTREGLENAIAFFIYTNKFPKKGFEDIMEHYTNEKPFIVESQYIADLLERKEVKNTCEKSGGEEHALFLPPDDALIDKLNWKKFGEKPFFFYVFLKAGLNENRLNTIRRIIDEQKPAHTCYGLEMLEPLFYLDRHTYLGVNTVLTMPVYIIGKTSLIGKFGSG